MAGQDRDRNIPAGLTEDGRGLSLEVSLEKNLVPTGDDDIDSAHEGLEFPSEEELATLPRVSDVVPWTAYSA